MLYFRLILSIKAQDSGSTPLSSTVSVYMNVVDENDNAPTFDPSTYSDEVWENATVGSSIMSVSATDIDSGKYTALAEKKIENTNCSMQCNRILNVQEMPRKSPR